MSTRISGTSGISHTHHTQSPKAELASLQKKIQKDFLSDKAQEVKAPTKAQLASAEKLVINQGVDMATVAYKIGDKMLCANTGFTGLTKWVELPASDAKRFDALKKDLSHAATKSNLKWSDTGPKFMNGSDSIDITPKGEMGVGYKAYFFDGQIWLAKTPVAPNAKTQWAQL